MRIKQRLHAAVQRAIGLRDEMLRRHWWRTPEGKARLARTLLVMTLRTIGNSIDGNRIIGDGPFNGIRTSDALAAYEENPDPVAGMQRLHALAAAGKAKRAKRRQKGK